MFKNTLPLFCLIVQSFLIQAQQNFSLSEAVDYAIKESSRLKIQKFDIDDAKQQVREYYAIGLPKLKAGATYNYFLDIPTSILPDFLSPAVYGILFKENVIPSRDIDFGSGFPAQFGTSHNLSGNIEFSTLLFDGSFFVGLKAQKLYQELIYKQIHLTEADVRYQVTKAYLSALSTEESIQIINKNISNLEKVYHEMSEINKAGFVEKLDVDRLELSLENLRTEKEKLSRISEVVQNLLKFQMNYPLDQKIILSDNLEQVMNRSYLDIMDPNIRVDINKRPETQVIDQSLQLLNINLKRYRMSYFPSLFGFASHSQSLQRNKLFDPDENGWLPTTVVGLQLSVPIFDGFDRNAKIARAKIALAKTNTQKTEFERAVQLEFSNARSQYLNALNTLESRKKSLQLAQKIYDTSNIKFKEGVGSSLELTQAERDLYLSQANVLEAKLMLSQAKADLDKALGNY